MSDELTEFLKKNNFGKRLDKLSEKLKGKTVLIYGAGLLFEAVKSNYDLSKLNIVAISDMKFKDCPQDEYFGYKVYAPSDIKDLKPDYVLVCIRSSVGIIEYLRYNLFEDTDTKILPLVKVPFFEILKEIWS